MQLSLGGVGSQAQGSLLENPPLTGSLVSCIFRPSADWMRPAHIVEGSLLCLKFVHLCLVKGKGDDGVGEALSRTITYSAQLTVNALSPQ